MKNKCKNSIWGDIQNVIQYFKISNTNIYVFIIPVGLSFIAAFLESFSIGLLIPLIKGVVESDVSFLKDLDYVGDFFQWIWLNSSRPNVASFSLILLIVFISTVSIQILTYVSGGVMDFIIYKFIVFFRTHIFKRYMKFGKIYFDKSSIGYLTEVLMRFTSEIADFLRQLNSFLLNIFMLLFYVALLCIISWKVTLASLFLLPIMTYSVSWLIKKIRQGSRKQSNLEVKINNKIQNILTSIPLVKAFSQESYEEEHFEKLNQSWRKLKLSVLRKERLFAPIQEIIILCALIIIVIVMAIYFHRYPNTNVAGLMVFFVVLKRMMTRFNSLNNTYRALSMVSGPIEKVAEVLNDEGKGYLEEGTEKFDGLKNQIEIKNLNFAYDPRRTVLFNLNLTIRKNEMTALVGKTGSGKTSIAHLIMRFYDCSEKTIFIDDVDIRNYEIKSLHQKIGLISQDVYLFNESIRYNLLYGTNQEFSENEIMDVITRCQLQELVKSLPEGLETEVGDRGVKLSGGEKQRLSIARVMLRQPEIIILDEATSSLDSKTEKFLQEAIENVIEGKTAIVIAHRLSTIKKADQVIVLDQGRVVEKGELKELIDKKGLFYAFWVQQQF